MRYFILIILILISSCSSKKVDKEKDYLIHYYRCKSGVDCYITVRTFASNEDSEMDIFPSNIFIKNTDVKVYSAEDFRGLVIQKVTPYKPIEISSSFVGMKEVNVKGIELKPLDSLVIDLEMKDDPFVIECY